MTRQIATLPQALLVAALMINLLLLLIVAEGAVVLRAAETSAGWALSCTGWYNDPTVNSYFSASRVWRANVLYAL